jgi:adenosylcobinamide-GDP ribazoletransferase
MTDTSSTFEKSDQTPQSWWEDFQLGVVFLTRIPWKLEADVPNTALNRALRAFPLVGLLVGAIGATVLGLASWMNLPLLAASLLAVLACVLVTGALHEDGLADVADGFGGGSSLEDKLRIMRDSQVGSYGVLALIFSIALRFSALVGLGDWGLAAASLIGVSCLSRVAPALLIGFMEPARKDGLAATMDKPDDVILLQCGLLGGALFLLCTSFGAGLMALVVCGLVLFCFSRLVQAQIKGQSGDVCGAAQQIVEITALLVLVSFA